MARLPCSICAASVDEDNLPAHIAKVHANVAPLPGWHGKRWGLFGASLALDGEAIALKTLLGTRRVALPCTVELGSLVGERTEAGMASYADEMNVPSETVRKGWYLRLGGRITIGCRRTNNVKAHWEGWTQGPRRRVPDLVVDRRVLVEIEHALARAGALRPRR